MRHRRPTPRTSLRSALALAVATAVTLGCTDDGGGTATTTTTVSATTSTTSPIRPADGELVLGVLLPTTGSGAQLGGPMINAVRLAAQRINEAGGVLGRDVRLVEVDEGGSVASAGLGFDRLIEAGVDAIVGPASSIAALGELASAVSAGVLTCSPTATALALDDFPDNGLFFRTAPSDSLQAVAIAQIVEQTGATSVAIGHLDDVFGRRLADAVERAARGRNLEIVTRVGFAAGDGDLSAHAAELLADDPGVVAILADADAGTRFLAAIGELTRVVFPPIVVNDAVRAARSSQLIVDLPAPMRTRITGVAPLTIPLDSDDFNGAYAAHAYDCATLIALAAVQAGTDAPARVAAQMVSVSDGGSVCRSFAGCLDRLDEGLQIDYTGPSGSTRLSARNGDPTRARFEIYVFDEDGRDVSTGLTFEASSS